MTLCEIDRLVAEKVMGWKYIQLKSKVYIDEDEETGTEKEEWIHFSPFYIRPGMNNFAFHLWHPTSDIAHAFVVLEKVIEMGDIKIHCHRKDSIGTDFSVTIGLFQECGHKLPEVICRAALKAVNAKPTTPEA